MSGRDPVPGWPGTDPDGHRQQPAWQQGWASQGGWQQPPDTFGVVPWRSSATRARWAQVLLTLSGIVAALTVLVLWQLLGFAEILDTFAFDIDAYQASADLLTLLGVAQVLLILATAVAFIAWQSRVVDNVPALGLGTPRWSPRWSIVAWLIPLGSLLLPVLAMRDVARRLAGGPWTLLMVTWWIAWVVASVMDRLVAIDVGPSIETVAAVQTWLRRILAVSLVSQVGFVVAAVLAVLLVRRMETAAQRAALVRPGPVSAAPAMDADGPRPAWSASAISCPACGAACDRDDTACWRCRHDLPGAAPPR